MLKTVKVSRENVVFFSFGKTLEENNVLKKTSTSSVQTTIQIVIEFDDSSYQAKYFANNGKAKN